MEVKTCEECGREIHGRADKKFCSDSCRNSYNNRVNAENSTSIRKINAILKKNRKILAEMNPEGKTAKTHRDQLLKQGFDFKYLTHSHTTKKQDTYYFCYEYGYLELDKGFVLLVKREED